MTETRSISRRVGVHPVGLRRVARVSVVVPLYNYGRYLESCLRSVLDQEGVEVDVLVLDDCSSDDSVAVARRMAEADARIRVVAHQVNRGHIPTVNEGMAQIDGEFVVKLDADDLLTPGSLARSVALLDEHPSTGFVYGFPLIFRSPEPPPPILEVRSWTVWPGRRWLARMCRRGDNCIKQPEVVMRTAALREAGPYTEALPHTSDFEMWMRLSARHDVGRVNGPHQGCYREHAASMSQTVHGGVLTDIEQRLRAFDRFFTEHEAILPQAAALRERAHRTLAREALGYALSAYARRVAEQEPIDGYLACALAAWPGVKETRDWHTLCRIHDMDATQSRWDPSLVAREAMRTLRFKVKWRRWRWSGV
jgi:hypothetical protein